MGEQKEWGIAADIREVFGFFVKMLSDDAGNVSSKRWLAVLTGTCVSITWSYISIHNSKVETIPWEVAALVCTLAGVVMYGKGGEQKPGG